MNTFKDCTWWCVIWTLKMTCVENPKRDYDPSIKSQPQPNGFKIKMMKKGYYIYYEPTQGFTT